MIYLIDPGEAENARCLTYCTQRCGIKPLYGVPPIYCNSVQ